MIEIKTTSVRLEAEVTGAEPITDAGLTGNPVSVVAMYTRKTDRDAVWELEAIEIPCQDMRAVDGSDYEPPASVARRFSDVPPTLERTMNHVRAMAGPTAAFVPDEMVRDVAQEILDRVEPSLGKAPDWARAWAEENLPGRELPKRAPGNEYPPARTINWDDFDLVGDKPATGGFITAEDGSRLDFGPAGEHGPETIFPRETRRSANLADRGPGEPFPSTTPDNTPYPWPDKLDDSVRPTED